MTSTGVVSQPVVPAAERSAHGPERHGHKAGEEDNFADLLSKLTSANHDARDGDSALQSEAELSGEHLKILGLLSATTSLADENAATGTKALVHAIPGFPTPNAQMTSQVAGSVGAVVSSAVPPTAAAIGTIAFAADTPTGGPPSQGSIPPQLTGAERGAAGAQPLPETSPMPVTVTVLKRETHLAPVSVTSAAIGAAEWAAAAQAVADRPIGSGRPATGTPAKEAEIGSSRVPRSGERPALAVDPLAVSPSRGMQFAPGARQGASAGPELTAGPGAAPTQAEAPPGVEQAPSGGRAEIQASSGTVSAAVQLIADRVVGEASETMRAVASTPALVPASPLASPVKVFHIQLQPAELGTVTIRLSLKEQSLHLDVEVGRGETAHLIQREKETLSSLLRSAGYLVESLDVRLTDASAGTSANSGQTSLHTQWGGQSGSSHADPRSPGARAQPDSRANHFGSESNRANEQMVEPDRRGGIYV
jgi:hypothetical protein